MCFKHIYSDQNDCNDFTSSKKALSGADVTYFDSTGSSVLPQVRDWSAVPYRVVDLFSRDIDTFVDAVEEDVYKNPVSERSPKDLKMVVCGDAKISWESA